MPKSNNSNGLKILKLTVANIKRVVLVEINAQGKEIILTGKNESGKTSVIDGLFITLQNAAATRSKDGKKPIEHPVRKGQKKAMVRIELDDYIITRKFTGDKSRLEVTNKDGVPFQRPQEIIDGLIGAIAFDPLEFNTMSSKDQAKVLRDLSGLDISELETERDSVYNQRTILGRDLSKEESVLESMTYDYDAPDQEVSAVDLTKELSEFNAMQGRNNSIDSIATEAVLDYDNSVEDRDMAKSEIDRLNELLADAQETFASKEDKMAMDKAAMDRSKKAKPEAWKGTPDIENAVSNVEDINARVRDNDRYSEVSESVKSYQGKYDEADIQLEKIREDISKAISSAKYPIDGLTVVDNQVYLDDCIFQDLSDAKKLVTSASIAMALNPKLRIMIARNASLLDEDNLQLLRDLSNDKNYQLIIEIVHTDIKSAVHLVDGRIEGQQTEIDLKK